MKKALAVILMIVSTSAFAQLENPFSQFSAKANFTNKTEIEWVQVKDINKTCESESRKRGNKGFGYSVEACAFWTKETFGGHKCTVYTRQTVDTATFGHEMRHCFQGAFHN